ncbi:hypothetical protein Taro_035809 [Colocasia esculenta]|uniref:Secreted protein n=1 Tax=Colocasia esculenta TaxID=4460 RepID=A0A843WEB9_COLES|nr:hypothetical protein [Colocasia esculenta]
MGRSIAFWWWGGSPLAIGVWWHRRARGDVVVHAWSEEEVANRREGPLVGSFFVNGRDLLCPLPSRWIGSPRGFVDSFTAFPMLPSPVCACVWFMGDLGIEDPVGLPPYWCRNRTVNHDISRGVAPIGRDLIAVRLAVAIACGGVTVPVLPQVVFVASLCVDVCPKECC